MILKFATPVDPAHPGKQAWKMVDKLESVIFWKSQASIDLIQDNEGDTAGATCVYLHETGASATMQDVNVVEATRAGNGKEFRKYVFSTEGYLCNDDGQTLERLIL